MTIVRRLRCRLRCPGKGCGVGRCSPAGDAERPRKWVGLYAVVPFARWTAAPGHAEIAPVGKSRSWSSCVGERRCRPCSAGRRAVDRRSSTIDRRASRRAVDVCPAARRKPARQSGRWYGCGRRVRRTLPSSQFFRRRSGQVLLRRIADDRRTIFRLESHEQTNLAASAGGVPREPHAVGVVKDHSGKGMSMNCL